MEASLEVWIPETAKTAKAKALIQRPDRYPTRHFRIEFFAADDSLIATHFAAMAPHGET